VVLVAQLAVLIGVVLWMVLVSATDDRRSELALARLRGRGRRSAARYLLAELLPVCLTGVVLGVLAAPAVIALVAAVVFPRPVPVEVRLPLVAAAVLSVVVVAAVVVAAARRAAREPVDSLLRGVPPPRRAGAGETALIAFALTAVVALVTVDLAGPVATLAPTLLAVATGLLLARRLGSVAAALGRVLLGRGRSAAGAGVLSSVRRPAARRVLVMVVVASALVVFCSDALVTGRHNRERAAEQSTGAPYVLSVRPDSLPILVDALRAVDPEGTRLTPVVKMQPDGSEPSGATVAVQPRAWANVASFPLFERGDVPWRAILAPPTPPLEVSGNQLRGRARFSGVQVDGDPSKLDRVRVGLQVRTSTGGASIVDVTPVPGRDGRTRVSAFLSCSAGCQVVGITLTGVYVLSLSFTVELSGLTIDGSPVDLGPATDWREASDDEGASLVPTLAEDGGLAVQVHTVQGPPPVLLHAWVPDPVPALVTSSSRDELAGPGLSQPIRLMPAGTLPRISGATPGARVVDLDGLLRRPDSYPVEDASVSVWGDDRALVERAATELRERGVPVYSLTTQAQARQVLDDTPAAWALSLAVLVGGAGLLVAALVMVVVTATTWRSRAADLAALRMTGVSGRSLRRLERLASLPVVLVGCLAGAGCGVVAAHFALPDVRQFTHPPEVSTIDYSVPWLLVAMTTLATVVALGALALVTSAWTVRRSDLARVRQSG
jgi:hypothetical protein